jgi:hypothetical protein
MSLGCDRRSPAAPGRATDVRGLIAVTNPDVVCDGKPDCVRRSTYKGKGLCTIITANKDVSYSRLGEQVRGCLK